MKIRPVEAELFNAHKDEANSRFSQLCERTLKVVHNLLLFIAD